jgi:Regulator of chromosome condensation (RCC1) repeat
VSTLAVVSCAVCEDGAVDCWGETSSQVIGRRTARGESDVTRIEGISDAVSIAVNVLHACALTRSGGVKCWGRLDSVGLQPPRGQAGQAPAVELVEVPLTGKATAVVVGDLHGCALLATAEVACWGVNDWGQLGIDDPSYPLAPTVIPGLRAIQIAAAGSATCAVDAEHRAMCWGWNGSGLMGAGDRRRRIGPVRIGRLDQVAELAMDGGRACLRRANQEVWCWGDDLLYGEVRRPARRPRIPLGHLAAVDDEVVSVVGEDGRVVVASGSGAAKAVPELPPVRAMSSRGGGACAVLQTGELRCWGQNQRGALVLAVEAGSPTK